MDMVTTKHENTKLGVKPTDQREYMAFRSGNEAVTVTASHALTR